MGWTTDKDVRLFALNCLAPKARRFLVAYERLSDVASEKTHSIEVDLEKKSA